MIKKEEFEIGDLVQWHEPFPDHFGIRDIGKGIVLEKREVDFGFRDSKPTDYKVFRNKYSDTMYFESKELEKVEVKGE